MCKHCDAQLKGRLTTANKRLMARQFAWSRALSLSLSLSVFFFLCKYIFVYYYQSLCNKLNVYVIHYFTKRRNRNINEHLYDQCKHKCIDHLCELYLSSLNFCLREKERFVLHFLLIGIFATILGRFTFKSIFLNNFFFLKNSLSSGKML